MLAAFHGQPQVRAAALARLEERAKARRLTSGAMFMGDGRATPAAAMAGSNDVARWEAELGLPAWMAFAIDYALGRLAADRVVTLARRLLEGVEPGKDLSRRAGCVVDVVLASVSSELGERGDSVLPLLEACARIRSLHADALSGASPSAAQWRSARQAATRVTNALQDSLDKSLGACIEAAAWDPVAAPTTVGDVLRLRGEVSKGHVDQLFGWTAEDDRRTGELLAEMQRTYKQDMPQESRDVFMLLREHHPEVEARLLAYTRFQSAQSVKAAERAAELLLHAMETFD